MNIELSTLDNKLIFLSLHLQDDLKAGEEVATCPSCSLILKVIYDKVS